ncbi:glycine--tRNA ligase [Candidatus Uhrbacteria bacterium CG10_big_fil_rev_8_21_14_0_10_48_11]|uniref:Glycine--tRNA ligase n=1 Tax=Candidatus Uhrbacteria bacterium CG10_big_fil_rev_8_21_14_0_10_48_11 TaxID=1975037 RepID=A0A2M8LFE4_9BACT|nr:MAG: glycine--tRNA ligase [Candidatus Uhrbacteria bacterium CG10_big_fil_rev_8_21_14_0_10_48_11]
MMTTMDELISLAKQRGFIFPGSEIYGGLANAWDYGPLGIELKNNIKQAWWQRFVHERQDIVGIDAALIMNPKVWEASGHLANFTDPLVEDKVTHERFRLDHLLEENGVDVTGMSFEEMRGAATIAKLKSPAGNELAEAKVFNLMLKTFLGPAEAQANTVYLRPETAQAMFVNFKQVLATTRRRIPFGIAQIGKAFRNEITPGNFIFRTREFEQMEIEYFVREEDWQTQFEAWLSAMQQWLKDIGIDEKNVHVREHGEKERAHYSTRTVDMEYDFPFGRKELYGLSYRGDYDLKAHMQASGEDMHYTSPDNPDDKFVPHVIEPTWGVDRTVLAVLASAYHEEEAPTADGKTEKRVVLRFPYWLAPVKVAVLPLSKKEPLQTLAADILKTVAPHFVCDYDETQSIGKRYRRQDEIGTPFCVTVDFDSLDDQQVTVRNRDTMQQDRVPISELLPYLKERFNV